MGIRILTDSASDIINPSREEITVIPLTVLFGEESFRDGVDLSHEEFYERLIESDTLPTTSQANPAQFEALFREAVEAGDEVLAILLSSKLSGTCQSAMIGAADFEGKVHIVDSENVTIGEKILVERAVELLDEGLSAAEIKERLDEEKKDIHTIALLDTLEYLKKGGRVSGAVAAIGGALSIKPVIAIQDGEVAMLGKARGSKNGNNLLRKEIEKTAGVDFDRPYALGYTGLNDDMLQKYVKDSQAMWSGQAEELPVTSVGGTIGTHAGPGAIAVAFFAKK